MLERVGKSVSRRKYFGTIALFAGFSLVLLPACGPRVEQPEGPGVTGRKPAEETADESRATSLDFEEVHSGASGGGGDDSRVVVSRGPEGVARQPELAGRDLDAGDGPEGVYIAVFAGRRNTGGYSVGVSEVSSRGNSVEVVVEEDGPPEGAIVTQALTYPHAVVLVDGLRGAGPQETEFFVTGPDGEELDWPVTVSPARVE